MSCVLGKFEVLSLLTFLTKIKQGRIQITGAKTHPPVYFDQWVCHLTNYQSNTVCGGLRDYFSSSSGSFL